MGSQKLAGVEAARPIPPDKRNASIAPRQGCQSRGLRTISLSTDSGTPPGCDPALLVNRGYRPFRPQPPANLCDPYRGLALRSPVQFPLTINYCSARFPCRISLACWDIVSLLRASV